MRAVYKGDGDFFMGIPARDLSAEELAGLDPEQRKLVGGGRLYDLVDEEPAANREPQKGAK